MISLIEIVGISFKDKCRTYYFSTNNLKLKKNITVMVETDQGIQFGKIVKGPILLEEKKLSLPLKNVLRIATKQDYFSYKKNLKDATMALKKCRQLVKKEKLNMQIIDCNYTFNRNQLIFRFLADTRIDFRSLAKQLASLYKTRIELRQVGVRDKAKEICGIGPCGRTLCCGTFLNEFESVSINMAKNQNIALNQTKINGSCGRLLCCLKYEDDNYTNYKKCLPQIGSFLEIEEGKGIVTSLDILNGKYYINIPNIGIVEKRVQNGKN